MGVLRKREEMRKEILAKKRKREEEGEAAKGPSSRVVPEKGDYSDEMMGIQYKAQGISAKPQFDAEEKTEEGGEEELPRKIVLYFREPCAAKIIGRAAGNIRRLRQDSGADLKTVKKPQYVEVTITGEPAYVKKAKQMVIECAGEEPNPELAPPKPLE